MGHGATGIDQGAERRVLTLAHGHALRVEFGLALTVAV